MTRGIEHYRSAAGIRCVRIHYSSDPDKDPDTPAGRKWFERVTNGIPGGRRAAQFRQEYEIDWEASGGELVLPQLEIFKDKIVIPPFAIPESWALYGCFDYGHRNPSAFYVNAIDHDGDVFTVWEFYKADVGYREVARAIRKCDLFSRLRLLPVADPSIWAQNQQSDNEVKSVAQLFFELPEAERIVFVAGKSGGDITFSEKIDGDFWHVPSEPTPDWKFRPRWKIFATCPKLVWELAKIRYAEWGPNQQEVKGLREQIVDKDNHGWDAQKYFFMMFFDTPNAPKEEKFAQLKKVDPAAWAYWQSCQALYKDEKISGLGEF